MMLAYNTGNKSLIHYWVEEMKIDLKQRSNLMWTTIKISITTVQEEVRYYLLSVDDIDIGLPEAAALGMRNHISRLVK